MRIALRLCLLPLLTVGGSSFAFEGDGPKATTEASCRRASQSPKLDGRLDDPVWKSAQLIDQFPSFWAGKPSTGATRAWLLWDDDALWFAAEMDDEELHPFGTKHNDRLWFGDVFELFFKPRTDKPAYYEFQTNINNAVFETAIPKRNDDLGDLSKVKPLGMQVSCKPRTGGKPGWIAEGRIPWTAFEPTGGRPKPGEVWTFALCRYDYGPKGTEPVLTSSAPLRQLSFHRHEDYGRLTFEPAKP